MDAIDGPDSMVMRTRAEAAVSGGDVGDGYPSHSERLEMENEEVVRERGDAGAGERTACSMDGREIAEAG